MKTRYVVINKKNHYATSPKSYEELVSFLKERNLTEDDLDIESWNTDNEFLAIATIKEF